MQALEGYSEVKNVFYSTDWWGASTARSGSVTVPGTGHGTTGRVRFGPGRRVVRL